MNQNKKMQNVVGNNKPWYKKKATIIALSTILGVGVLATAIAVPLVLTSTSSSKPDVPAISQEVITATNKILNGTNNKDSRVRVWNDYMVSLRPKADNDPNSIDAIVRTDQFINEFINFLTDNLYVTTAGTEAGAITQSDVNKIKSAISNATNKPCFKDTNLTTYTELFNFISDTSMFGFKNKATGATFEFNLFMPFPGLDLVYNDDQTIDFNISDKHDASDSTNVRLTINAFSDANIAITRHVYFKPGANIRLPNSVTKGFSPFFIKTIQNEESLRKHMLTTFADIKNTIDADTSRIKSLSYWNSFALLYDRANIAFLKEDLLKETTVGGMYKFLTANAKDSSSNPIPKTDLDAIKTIAETLGTGPNPAPAKGDLLGITEPFVSSPVYSNLLLNTTNTSGDKYSLELDITKFSYEFAVNSLFESQNSVIVTPSLELSGKVVKKASDNSLTTYNIANALYDVSDLISLSGRTDLETGGFIGFFIELMDLTNRKPALINGLVKLNSKPVDEQVAFWNEFSSANATKLIATLKSREALSTFINEFIDSTNLFGFASASGSLPTITPATLKSSIENAKQHIEVTNLNFTTDGTSTITLKPTNGIVYGTDATNDKFESITIYFGYEANSLSNINFTSKLTGGSNISFSQTVGETTGLTDENKVIAAASKRLSIVFKKTTTGSTKASTSVAYFGQSKTSENQAQQNTKPIIISDRILRGNNLIDAIIAIK